MVERLMNYIDANLSAFTLFGLRVLFAILVFIIGRKVISWICKLLKNWFEKGKVDTGVQQFAISFVRAFLYLILVTSIAVQFGLEPTSIAALLASAGVAIGLALQGSLSNFAGGVLILILKPFVVGDYILEDTNKNEGIVTEIQIFYTKLQSVDNKTVVIPNGTLANASLTNITGEDYRRLDLSIGISYEADLLKAKQILRDIVMSKEEICKDRDIMVMVEELGDSAVVLGCRSWVKTEKYWPLRWELLEEIKLTFDKEGIEIPYNQMQVHVVNKN